jgi:hypothetical protein
MEPQEGRPTRSLSPEGAQASNGLLHPFRVWSRLVLTHPGVKTPGYFPTRFQRLDSQQTIRRPEVHRRESGAKARVLQKRRCPRQRVAPRMEHCIWSAELEFRLDVRCFSAGGEPSGQRCTGVHANRNPLSELYGFSSSRYRIARTDDLDWVTPP